MSSDAGSGMWPLCPTGRKAKEGQDKSSDGTCNVFGGDSVHATAIRVGGTEDPVACQNLLEPIMVEMRSAGLEETVGRGQVSNAEHLEADAAILDVQSNIQLIQATCNIGTSGHEAEAYRKLKWFCSQLVKKIAPPLLKEVQASSLRPEAEPFMPRRTTHGSRKAATTSSKATHAENVLMRVLGLAQIWKWMRES